MTGGTPLASTRGLGTLLRRELVMLAIAGAALLVILPFAAEPNPEFEAAQEFLDDLSAATVSIRDGASVPADFTVADNGFVAASGSLADGTVGTIVAGTHGGRCFAIHWQGGAPRAGVLGPGFRCDASSALLATLPSPSFVEVFPGTVPPLDATQLVSRIGEARHGTVHPFPAERTAPWFLPVTAILVSIVIWQLVGITIKLLVHRSEQRSRWIVEQLSAQPLVSAAPTKKSIQ